MLFYQRIEKKLVLSGFFYNTYSSDECMSACDLSVSVEYTGVATTDWAEPKKYLCDAKRIRNVESKAL